jgi:hypothetical protein
MNGFKPSKTIKNGDHHTYLAPENVVLPKSVGRFCFFRLKLL